MTSLPAFSIRPYRVEDREAILSLAPRLAVGIAPWRSAAGMTEAARGWIEGSLAAPGADRALFVAEDRGRTVVGFASVARQTAFTGEAQAYIGELAVGEAWEGRGIGHALLEAVERWAEQQGLSLVVLDTGAANARACRFYERNGFVVESVQLTKVLPRNGS
jgi:ribosomal protein S18 acetylase RimI-like enzyme